MRMLTFLPSLKLTVYSTRLLSSNGQKNIYKNSKSHEKQIAFRKRGTAKFVQGHVRPHSLNSAKFLSCHERGGCQAAISLASSTTVFRRR